MPARALAKTKALREKIAAARALARAVTLDVKLQSQAVEARLRAEREAGRFLAALRMRGGDRRSKGPRSGLVLKDLGIAPDHSKRWQRLAAVAEKEFERYLQRMKQLGGEVTSAQQSCQRNEVVAGAHEVIGEFRSRCNDDAKRDSKSAKRRLPRVFFDYIERLRLP